MEPHAKITSQHTEIQVQVQSYFPVKLTKALLNNLPKFLIIGQIRTYNKVIKGNDKYVLIFIYVMYIIMSKSRNTLTGRTLP